MADLRPDALAAALRTARTLGERLNNATEVVNQRLREAEAAIAALGLGVRGSVALPLPTDEDRWRRYLHFGKVGGDWLLYVESGWAEEYDDWTMQPLLNASRETRLAAIDLLPALVENLVSGANNAVMESEAKARALEGFLATIQGQPGQGHEARGEFGTGHPGMSYSDVRHNPLFAAVLGSPETVDDSPSVTDIGPRGPVPAPAPATRPTQGRFSKPGNKL